MTATRRTLSPSGEWEPSKPDLVEAMALNMVLIVEEGVDGDQSSASVARAFARAALTTIEASGFRVVPITATEEMEREGCCALGPRAAEAIMAASLSGDKHSVARVKMRLGWNAMLAAAPKVTK